MNKNLGTSLGRAGAALLLLAMWCEIPARSADWPEFGGTDARNMVSTEKNLPASFTEPGTKNLLHLKWSTRLGKESYGTPTIGGGRIFLGTNNTPPRDPRYTADRGVAMCLDEATGAVIWTLPVPRFNNPTYHFYIAGLGFCSSPTIDGDVVYAVDNRDEVLCLAANGRAPGTPPHFADMATFLANPGSKSSVTAPAAPPPPPPPPPPMTLPAPTREADILWCYDLIHQGDISPHDAADCAPLVMGDHLWVVTADGVNHQHIVSDKPEAPTMIVFDKHTGQPLAQDDCLINHRVLHCSWSSPTLGQVGGKPAVFLGAGDGWLYAFDPNIVPGTGGRPGLIKKIWSVDVNPPEHRTGPYRHNPQGPSEVIGEPVYLDGKLYLDVGQDPTHGEGFGNVCCVDATSGKILWNDPKVHRSLSTCAIAEGLLFTADLSGFVYCFDAATGQRLWEHQAGSEIWGSPLIADGKVYIGTANGKLLVFAPERTKRIISENHFDAKIKSSLVAANGTIYLMTLTTLYAFSNKVP